MDIHIIIEKGDEGFWVYTPELPGCTSWGATQQEARSNMIEAIHAHLEIQKEYGEQIREKPVVELLHV